MKQAFPVADLAWAAGLIDGEGCITIQYKKASIKNGSRNPGHSLLLKVTMTHEPTIRRLYKLFEVGTVQLQRISKKDVGKSWNPAYSWICNPVAAAYVIGFVRPYLFTKADEADIALEFASLPRARGSSNLIPVVELERRHALYVKMHDIKSGNIARGHKAIAHPLETLPGKKAAVEREQKAIDRLREFASEFDDSEDDDD